VLIQTGRDEHPCLRDDHRRGEKKAGDQRHLHVEDEGFRKREECKLVCILWKEARNGKGQNGEELLVDEPAENGAHDHGNDRYEKPTSELL